MALALLASDLLFLALAVGLYGGAWWVAAHVASLLPTAWLGVPLAVLAFYLALTFAVALLHLPLPRLAPGRYEMMKGPVFWSWMLRSFLRRLLLPGPVKPLVFSFASLRFLALRALGARTAFASNMSTDIDLLDPALLVVEPGATLGARCLVSGHYVDAGKLVLGEVRIGAGALLAAEVMVGPMCVVGPRARVLASVKLGPGSEVGERAVLEAGVRCEGFCVVAPGARVPAGSDLLRDERFPPETA